MKGSLGQAMCLTLDHITDTCKKGINICITFCSKYSIFAEVDLASDYAPHTIYFANLDYANVL